MFSFEDLYGTAQPSNSSSNTQFQLLTPEVITLEDGSLQIAGPVVGVSLDSLTYDEKNNAAIFKFSKDGKSISKFINDPSTNQYLQAEPDEAIKLKRTKDVYLEIQRNVSNFFYNNAVKASLPATFDFKTFVEALSAFVEKGESKSPNEVSLKITFANTQGDAPKFTIPNYAYLSNNEQYPILWGKKDENGQYPEVGSNASKGYGYQNFSKVSADFDNSVDSIFVTSDIELL